MDKKTFTVKEFMAAVGISKSFAYRLINMNQFPVIRLGHRKVLISAAVVDKIIAGYDFTKD